MPGKTGVTLYLILVLTVGVGLAQKPICGHEYFDLQTLQRYGCIASVMDT